MTSRRAVAWRALMFAAFAVLFATVLSGAIP